MYNRPARLKKPRNKMLPVRVTRNIVFSGRADKIIVDALSSGRYIVVDHRICLRSAECLTHENGILHIKQSEMGRQFTIDYLLHCHRVYDQERYEAEARKVQAIYSKQLRGVRIAARKTRTVEYPHTDHLMRAAQESRAEQIRDVHQFFASGTNPSPNNLPPAHFPGALSWFMSNREPNAITEEELAELIGVSPKTIQRYVTGKALPRIETAVALCVGLNLNPLWAQWFVELAKHVLQPTDETDQCYLTILCFAADDDLTVYECNDFLTRKGRKPLTRGDE